MDYTITVSVLFEPRGWMIGRKIKNFLRKRREGDLILLIDDKIPNLPLLLATFKNYDRKQPGEFIGENPIYLLAPSIEYDGLSKIVHSRIKSPKEEGCRKRRINYVPNRFYSGTDAVDALRKEEGYNMEEFRIYAEFIKKGKLTGLNFNYGECLREEHKEIFEKIDRKHKAKCKVS